jgi:ADP-heptose:LPS heptosyltransferase
MMSPQLFAAAAQVLASFGCRSVITWGPGETALAQQVLELAPGSMLAPPTEIEELATILGSAALAVCNNSGPMHLAVAAGAPTLAFFVRMDAERWGHAYEPHRMVDLTPVWDSPSQLESVVRDEVTQFARRLISPRGADRSAAVRT